MNATKYVVRFGTTNLKCTIHAATCNVVANALGRKFVCFPVEGATAAEVRASVIRSEELVERGLDLPVICKCAK